MTSRYPVPLLLLVVAVLCSVCDCALADDCQSKDGSSGNCTTASQENELQTPSLPLVNKLTETSKPKNPKDMDTVFRPTPLPPAGANSTSTDEPKGRALNFTMEEQTVGNVLSQNATHDEFGDLSDVSIDNDDEDDEMLSGKILAPKGMPNNRTIGVCEQGGLTYENGEKIENDCDSICTCVNGRMDCADRCSGPLFRKGKKIDDPLCSAKESDDPCCSVMVCAHDTETEPLEICTFKNKTYNRGDIFDDGCEKVCTCEAAGATSCKSRCPEVVKPSDRCVEVPDPNDPCCKKVLCDVTLDDHEPDREEEKPKHKLISARFINVTTILLKFDSKFDDNDSLPIIDITDDKKTWKSYQMLPGGYLFVKTNAKYLRVDNSDDIIDVQNTELGPKQKEDKQKDDTKDSAGCVFKEKHFKIGEEYNDNCEALCVCEVGGMNCLKMECPTYFGVDVLDPHCVEWETVPPDFKPVAPHCCADELRCKNNGSCEYEGQSFKNWEQLPINVTGCEKRCYCEMGKVECQNTCPPITALPPPNMNCPPQFAVISHIADDDCCKYWVCNAPTNGPEHSQNGTMNDSAPTTTPSTTDESFFGSLAEKKPSKVLGPLLVYSNDEQEHKPLSPDENPYFSKNQFTSPEKISDTADKTKHNDMSRPPKPVSNSVFVTPPTPSKNKPVKQIPIPPFIPQEPPKQHFALNDKNTPEEILQILHQHPEFNNYPPGSVVEVHNFSPHPQNPVLPPYANQNGIMGHGNPQHIPILVQNSVGQHLNELPPGVTLEQILQEIHKNINPHQQSPILNYPGPQGPLLIAQQSGPVIPSRPNASVPGVGGFPNFAINGFPPQQDDVTVTALEALDAHTVRLAFMVPPVIVGLHGRVEVRYTHKNDADISSWELQVFAPPNDLIATPQLEFDLLDLKADTEYKIKITITLRDLHNTPSSRVYKIRTLKDVQTTTLPPMIPIEPDLAITDINATWVTVVWRKFTEYELQFIDGVQLRFKEIDGKIYAATPLIHRAVTTYTLENLKPNTKYEIGIFFIPFPGQLTELHAENMLHFTTANEVDTYGFNVTLEISQIKSQSVEITWNGVPYPEDKYVNIYRAIYQSDSGKEDHSTFKIAKRDSPTKTVIMDLKPGTRYRLWLEVYLTNGKIKTSNVQDFITKPRAAPALGSSTHQDKLSRSEHLNHKGDYYGPLVIVAILAAIAILSTLILLLILVRRHNQNKAAITPPSTRISQSAYDNPTYKVEIQQETMGL